VIDDQDDEEEDEEVDEAEKRRQALAWRRQLDEEIRR
jgi:hypothetical protein